MDPVDVHEESCEFDCSPDVPVLTLHPPKKLHQFKNAIASLVPIMVLVINAEVITITTPIIISFVFITQYTTVLLKNVMEYHYFTLPEL